ncbi:MAG TPA: zinc ABC transporter substrate-binding protein [Xanthobacteraceae bacterium]|nr:zinc ABC transporter substrate-binding protein [Xanthobacteraceae bacterium]
MAGLAFLLWPGAASAETQIPVVAAESFYGDVARQIGGPQVAVTSIISSAMQDPHEFEPSPSVARAVVGAQVVILNGASYDPWMDKLLAATSPARRSVIVAADLVHRKPGDNPHLWYDPATMPAVAAQIAGALARHDPMHKDAYRQRLAAFLASLVPIDDAIRTIKSQYGGTPVTATEPVFGDMARSLGLVMRNARFQLAIMNETEPSASDVAALQGDLAAHRVRILFYNAQVSDDLTTRMLGIARAAHVPVVGVSETEPADKTYQEWIAGTLDAVRRALADGGS